MRFYVSLKGERGSKVNHHVHMTKTGRRPVRSVGYRVSNFDDFNRFDDFASLSFFYPSEYMTGVWAHARLVL